MTIFNFEHVFGRYKLIQFNQLTTNVPHHIETLNWFALQISWLVSIWWGTLVVNVFIVYLIIYPLSFYLRVIFILETTTLKKTWRKIFILRTVICFFKFRNGNTRTVYKFGSKLWIKTAERRQWHRSGFIIVTFEQNSHIVPVFPLLTLNNWKPVGQILIELSR